MRAAAVLVLVAAVLAAAGCRDDDGDARRDAVENYIESVNRAEAQLNPAVRDAQRALREFASGRVTASTAARLRGGSATMSAARARLAAVDPPPEARALHADLLRLVDLQSALALELGLAVDYVTSVGRATEPVERAAAALGRELRSARTGADQAAALDEFAASAGDSLTRLGPLAPPPSLLPWHEGQEARLARSRRDALALAEGIRQKDAKAVDRALKAFTTRSPDAGRESQEAAVKAFNTRLRDQERLLGRIAREQTALGAVG